MPENLVKFIAGLTILSKYSNGNRFEMECAEDAFICCPDLKPEDVSKEDQEALNNLGFKWRDEYQSWAKYI